MDFDGCPMAGHNSGGGVFLSTQRGAWDAIPNDRVSVCIQMHRIPTPAVHQQPAAACIGAHFGPKHLIHKIAGFPNPGTVVLSVPTTCLGWCMGGADVPLMRGALVLPLDQLDGLMGSTPRLQPQAASPGLERHNTSEDLLLGSLPCWHAGSMESHCRFPVTM